MLVKECSPEKGHGGAGTGLGEEVSKEGVSAGDLLQPDPTRSPGGTAVLQSCSHLEARAGGGLLHTIVSQSQAIGFLRELSSESVEAEVPCFLCFSPISQGDFCRGGGMSTHSLRDGCTAWRGGSGWDPSACTHGSLV